MEQENYWLVSKELIKVKRQQKIHHINSSFHKPNKKNSRRFTDKCKYRHCGDNKIKI